MSYFTADGYRSLQVGAAVFPGATDLYRNFLNFLHKFFQVLVHLYALLNSYPKRAYL